MLENQVSSMEISDYITVLLVNITYWNFLNIFNVNPVSGKPPPPLKYGPAIISIIL